MHGDFFLLESGHRSIQNPNGAAALLKAQKGNTAAVVAVKAKAADRASDLAPVVTDINKFGATSHRKLASELNRRAIVTARHGAASGTLHRRVRSSTGSN